MVLVDCCVARDWAQNVVVLILISITALPLSAEELRNPFNKDPAAAEEGHALIRKAGCLPCHGLEAQGSTGPDLTDDEWRFKPTDEMFFRTISKGRKGTIMPAFETKLSPEEIWKIIEYLRDKNRQRQSKDSPNQ
jgi:mono/diheme cytochrome c family protein